MSGWPDHHFFKFNGIFGPIITSYMDPNELKIILDFCDIKKIIDGDLVILTLYCLENKLDYLDYFVERTDPEVLLRNSAMAHSQFYVDLAVARGANNFNWAMIFALATGDIPWVTYFNDKTTNMNYKCAMCAAMAFGHLELVRLMWAWDINNDIDPDAIVANLGDCTDPLGMLALFDELNIFCNIDTSVDENGNGYCIEFTKWDPPLQLKMIQALRNRGYDVNSLMYDVIKVGNIDGLRMMQFWGIDHAFMSRCALSSGNIGIMELAKDILKFQKSAS